MDMLSIFSLFFIYLRSKIYFYWEEKKVFRLFYPCHLFQKCDLAMKEAYRFYNPFTISKNFLRKKGEKEINVYGEIPLTSLLKIAQECEIMLYDHVFELGCGRGRSAFFLRSLLQCRVTAVDFIPFFILRAQKIVETFNIKHLTFVCDDILHVALEEATCIYLYGTCLSDKLITQLCGSFLSLPTNTKIITLSYPLKEYHKEFKIIKQFTVTVPWGNIDVFLNQKL